MQIGDIYTEYTPELAIEANLLRLVISPQEDGTFIIEGQPTFDWQPREEVRQYKEYLSSTDWAVVKCMELGVSIAEVYPEIHQKRTEARAEINKLEAL